MQTRQLFPNASPTGFGQTTTLSITTGSLDPGESIDVSLQVSGSYLLLKTKTSGPAWVRFYGSAYGRDSDTRVDPGPPFPNPGTGFFAEIQTTGQFLETFFSPAPEVQSQLGQTYLKVRNDSGLTTPITVTLEVEVGAYPLSPSSPPYGCNVFVNTQGQTDLSEAWKDCTLITQLPLLNLESVTNLESAWQGCSSLIFVPVGLFDNCPCENLANAFVDCSLSEQSVDNILVSLDNSEVTDGVVDITGGSNAGPSSTGLSAKVSLEGKGWTVNVEEGSITTSVNLNTDYAYSLTAFSDGTVFAGSYDGYVYKSIDFGSTFDSGTLVGAGPIYTIAACGGSTVIAGTEADSFPFISTDLGVTWSPGEDFNEYDVNSVGYAGNDTVYAGTYGYIHKSIDNGQTWPQSTSPYASDYYYSLAFPGEDEIVAGSYYYGFISYSSDGGLTWNYTDDYVLDGAETIRGLASNGAGIVVAGTADNGKVFVSTDSGQSWDLGTQLGGAGEINTIAYSDAGLFFAGTDDDGKIYYSSDNGATWQEFFDPSLPGGYVYSLCDGGNNNLIAGIDNLIYSISFPSNNSIPSTQVYPAFSTELPADLVRSDTTNTAGSSQIENIVSISQVDYNNLPSTDSKTLYVIVG